jgi:exosortase/archaeosortase family protein
VANNKLLLYCIKFLLAYCILYYGSQAIIGFSAPGGHYSSFVQNYFNYPALLRKALLRCSGFFLEMKGYHTEMPDEYKIRMVGGRGVRMVYSCLGIGVSSFWAAFMIANETTIKKKIYFILFGLLFIFLINVGRIMLLFIAANKGMSIPFGIEHHTLFTVASYILIIFMIVIFDRSEKQRVLFRKNTGVAD